MSGRATLRRVTAAAAVILLLGLQPVGARGIRPPPSPEPLLPDLVAVPVEFVTTDSLGACQPIERVEQGAGRCLRFDQYVANEGAGPLEIRYDVTGLGTDQRLLQRVYRSDGSSSDRFASSYQLHAAHAHFHYVGFSQASLWQSDTTGQRLGTTPVRVGRKAGFCLMDMERQDAAAAPKPTYVETGCKLPEPSTAPAYIQGISPGWADVYSVITEGQFVEISGLSEGLYRLEISVDPDETLREQSRRNNVSAVTVEICAHAAQVYPPSDDLDRCH